MSSRRLLSLSAKMGLEAATVAGGKVDCKLLVCGGGAGGCSIAAKFASKLGPGAVVVIDPAEIHYYQPMWTLVGGGLKSLEQSARPMGSVLPKNATWIKDSVAEFVPEGNTVLTANGTEIKYEYMVVALGLDMHYEKIPGLVEALNIGNSGVCSNYSPKYVNKTLQSIKQFEFGNATFTYPNTPIKCAGAPQKAAYISDALFRKMGKRENCNVRYKTSLPVIFGAKKYADSLWEVCKRKNIQVHLRQELVEIKPREKEAVFKNLDNPSELKTETFEMLHVCPPMSAPAVLLKTPQLTDANGYLSIDKETLQHTKFPNVFGIGDCTNLPTSKTAAAVAGQNGILEKNLTAVMEKKEPTSKYNGYSSCPLITSLNTCILAEFDYNLEPLETLPIDQSKERYLSFFMKKEVMPFIYWNLMMKGRWNGPGWIRSLLHLGLK